MTMRTGRPIACKGLVGLCVMSFFVGLLFNGRIWTIEDGRIFKGTDCETKHMLGESNSREIMGEVTKTREAIQTLDKTVSTLEMELAVSRTSGLRGFASVSGGSTRDGLQKAFAVIGINTAFSSKKRRDSVRDTWMPRGSKLKRLEKEKGVVIRFVIGHSGTPGGGVLDRGIDAEEAETGDFLRLDHVEGYHELSAKTRVYFTTVVSIWDADFYVKVDDDVHVNLGQLVPMHISLSRYS
ncbi:putative beta-1,3-galactosyltransferase 8 [Acorus gramineus]|uniref:Hexosyltransferase n=1 Tax=Acorus gramineus TaxID=55184 RepID=A0AAV9AT95_ACOGR|nr:putative beta-1,3-galactosyltransferase 8 [Acorus gramineus]